MLKKAVLVVMMAVVMVAGLGTVSAGQGSGDGNTCMVATSDGGTVAAYCDGRLNGTDIDAPIAIYYSHQDMQVVNDDDVLEWQNVTTGIEIWAINPEDNQGHLVLSVPMAQITSAMVSSADVQIAAQNGYSLSYSPSKDAFWVTAPGGYTFAWNVW
jgi:hypothetical protein